MQKLFPIQNQLGLVVQLLTIGVIVFFLMSCEPNTSKPDEVHNLTEQAKEWVVLDSTMFTMIFVNQDSTREEYKERFSKFDFESSSTSQNSINWYTIRKETFNQCFQNTQNNEQIYFRLNTSTLNSHGNLLEISLKKTDVYIDINGGYVYGLKVNNKYETIRRDPNGNLIPFKSTVEILDSFNVQAHAYQSVMYIKINDLLSSWDSETVKEIYYAKNVGLIKFVQQGGNVYERVFE